MGQFKKFCLELCFCDGHM